MKYFRIILFLSAIFCLASCVNKDDIEILRKINVTINTSDVVKSFVPYNPGDAEMLEVTEGKAKLLIRTFIYDDNGKLAASFSRTVSDYGATYSFSTGISATSPTVVVFSYCIIGSEFSPSSQAYVVSGESYLSSLEVTSDIWYGNIKWRALGGYIKKLDSSVTSLDVRLSPLGAIVYLWFRSIHSHDGEASAPDSYTFWHHSNDQVTVDGESFRYSSSLSTSYSFMDSISPSDYPKSTNIYNIAFMMPGVFNTSASYEVGSSRKYFSSNDNTRVEAGKQYKAEINCSSYSMSFNEGN